MRLMLILQKFICCFIFVVRMISCEEKQATKNNMALAIYEPPKSMFPIFQTHVREFSFAGHQVHITQNWEKTGVAAVVWDAAVVLAKYLETNDSVDLAGKKVIELGAGTGLVGIVAAYLGAHVIITDRKMALAIVHENVLQNSCYLNASLVSVCELEWGQDLSTFNGPFEYILGADIVYIEETFPQLLQTITQLCDKKTVVLLSCKIRYERDSKFLALLNKIFEVTQVHYDETVDIYIYKAVQRKEIK